MPTKYLNFLALSAIALLACSFSVAPVNALSLDSNGLQARHAHIGQTFAKRQNKRCKARSPSPAAGGASSNPPTSSTAPPPNTNAPQPATTSPAPAPAPAPTPPATPPPASGGNGKAGLAMAVWDNNVGAILSNFKTNHVSAVYNWSPAKVPGAEARGYENIPMLWGTKDVNQWRQLVVPGYARHVLGFNEPDHGNQAYLSPGDAANLWNQNMRPLRNSGYILISPAVTSGPGGIAWMRDFLNACGGNCVDKIAVHWYGTSSTEFINYLQTWYNTFQKPLWVTEFACMDFVSYAACPDVRAFARNVRGFMDSTWWVEKYFPFDIAYSLGNVNGVNQLLGQDLRPTELAWVYFA